LNQAKLSFVEELRRRKVFRVAIVYLGVTFALLQFADIAVPALNLPEWSITLVLVLALIGLPVALVAAWALDMGDDIQPEEAESGGSSGAQRLTLLHALELAVIVILAAAVGYLYFTRTPAETGPEAAQVEAPTPVPSDLSIAVLPFVNMSDDPSNEYFSDGISEELLDALAKLEKLRVVARTSSFSFKGRNLDVRNIGRELNVATVLEGSVRKAGNSVRITAQLIDTADGYHLWSDTYDRELDDIFAVQDEIAKAIVIALHVPLGLQAEDHIVDIGTENTAAYNEYLQGRHLAKRFGEQTFEQAINHFEKAVALDPEFAAAYSAMAHVYYVSAFWRPREIVMPLSVQAFETALALDPVDGLALITKAQYITLSEWDWQAARTYFERGLEDIGGTSLAVLSYATIHLMPLGQLEQAGELLAAARANDPMDPSLALAHASQALFSGDLSRAIELYELNLALDPENFQAGSALCSAYVNIGDVSAAEALLGAWETRLGFTHPWFMNCVVLAQLARGEPAQAGATLQSLAGIAEREPGLAFLVGDTALAIGETEMAIDWYERSLAGGEIPILMLRTRLQPHPELLQHPRFQVLLEAMRLDDESLRAMGLELPPVAGGVQSAARP